MVLVLLFFIFLSGCSHKAVQPEQSTWQSVPCEYRFEGGNESTLLVRASVVEFDSAKIVAEVFQWTVFGDTLTHQTTLFPREVQKSESYTIFVAERSLPVNSALRSIELLIKR
jgi:hypothetical protein